MNEKIKWSHADLNRRPPACHAGALPAELWPQISKRHSYKSFKDLFCDVCDSYNTLFRLIIEIYTLKMHI